jgi:cytochrome c peroxidase
MGRFNMKIFGQIMAVLFISAAISVFAAAVSKPSLEQGKSLFEDSSLGTSGKSCATCHPGGRGLEDLSGADHSDLEKTTNRCIEKALKGKPLAVGSVELASLVIYQKSIGAAKK